MVAVREDAAAATGNEGAVQALRGGDLEGAQSEAERNLVVGLDDQVEMVVLDGDVDDAEVGAGDDAGEGFADRGAGGGPAEVAEDM